MEDLINATVRLKSDGPRAQDTSAPGVKYGLVVDETDTKARVRWPNGGLSWELKRDLYVLD